MEYKVIIIKLGKIEIMLYFLEAEEMWIKWTNKEINSNL